MQTAYENGALILYLTGRVDAVNASEFEAEIRDAGNQYGAETIIIDCDGLTYMSSAGLRIILRLKKKVPDTSLVNVHPDFYEILDTTGFTAGRSHPSPSRMREIYAFSFVLGVSMIIVVCLIAQGVFHEKASALPRKMLQMYADFPLTFSEQRI